MVTLTVMLVLIFVPASRRILAGILSGALSLLGLLFLISWGAERRR